MACILTSGRALMCKDNMGGIKTLFFGAYDKSVAHQFTVVGKEVTVTPVMTVYRYDVEDGGAGLVDNINKSVENGSRFFEEVTDFTLNTLDKEMNAELDNLTAGTFWTWAEDYNGNVLLLGLENGSDVIGGTINTGTAKGDRSGYALTVSSKERLSFPFNIPFTNFPFDTLVNITVEPAYPILS